MQDPEPSPMRRQISPSRLRNEQGQVWLNVASSTTVLEGFQNLDNHLFLRILRFDPWIRPLVPQKYHRLMERYREARARAPMIRHDCRKPLPVPKSSVDHILCSHFLEHVYPGEADAILRDFHRALRPGATLHVIVPDLARLVDHYQEKRGSAEASDAFVRDTLLTRESAGTLRYRLLELRGGFGLQHRWMYDRAAMCARVEAAGFELVNPDGIPSADYRRGDGVSLHVVARKAPQPAT